MARTDSSPALPHGSVVAGTLPVRQHTNIEQSNKTSELPLWLILPGMTEPTVGHSLPHSWGSHLSKYPHNLH